MSRQKLTVVLSQAQGKNPAKRALEEAVAAALLMEPGVELAVVPYLYDLGPEHTGRLFLESVPGDMVVLAWLYPRAAYWVLDRDGIKGHFGETQLKRPDADEEDEDGEPEEPKGIGAVAVLERHIYCLDLRDFNNHQPYVDEVRRIAQECKQRRDQKQAEKSASVLVGLGTELVNGSSAKPQAAFAPEQLLIAPDRRWYPVIDYSRCTNCMECIDFCLFGVYGVDTLGRINVENQDSCKKGCPACSRVCPEQAIMFPDYKSPAIAGAPVGAVSGLKIDLSKLFGGDTKDALGQAVLERDRELVKDGRDAVGMAVGIPKRQAGKPAGPKDDLDNLMDSLDALDI
ncbi:Fe-S containing oxidoreductase [Planctomycetaceae bacterium SCGC AG-212-F19]|nr:Fe-S containing oxidoreductase [Planctomycetaceae bacterium SCGC AG-212-F19]